MMENSEIQRQLTKKLLVAVGKQIDIPKLAKKLAPSVEKAITAAVLKVSARIEMDDFVHDIMGRDFYKAMEQLLTQAITDKLKRR